MSKRSNKIATKVNNEDIIQRLDEIRSKCYDDAKIAKIDELKRMLARQKPSALQSCVDIDSKIKSILEDIENDFQKEINADSHSFDIRLKRIASSIKTRDKICPHEFPGLSKRDLKERKIADKVNLKHETKLAAKRAKLEKQGKSLAPTYSADELYDMKLDEIYGERDEYYKRAQNLYERIKKDANDRRAKSDFKNIEIKIKGTDKRIELFENEQYRSTAIKEITKFTDEQKALLDNRETSDDMFKVIMDKYAAGQQTMKDDIKNTEAALAAFMGDGEVAASSDVVGGAKAGSLNKAEDDYFKNSSLMAQLGGMPDPKEEALKETLANIDSTIVALKNMGSQLEKSKQKYDDEIDDYEADLLGLKSEYEAANASQSKSVADKIKSINALRLASIRNRDRVIRTKDQLNKQLEMAISLKGIRDIESAKKAASSIMGKNFNLEDWAMFMKEYDKKENYALDELEIISDVANSEDVKLSEMNENETPYKSEINKNDHLFDGLWDELENKKKRGSQQ